MHGHLNVKFYRVIEKKMDGIVYLDLLEQYVFAQIETSEQEIVSRVIFMLSFQLLSD